jgi:hypothetical protein
VLAGLIGVVILLCFVSWIGFSFWVGGVVGDETGSEGWATLTAMFLIFTPVAFLIGATVFG